MNFRDLRTPDARTIFDRTMERLKIEKSMVFETIHRRRNGMEFPAEVSTRFIEVDGAVRIQSITRDITERKSAENQIQRINRLYAVLSRCGQALVKSHTESALLERVCSIAVKYGGFVVACAGMVDKETQLLVPGARAGEHALFLEEGDARNAIGEACRDRLAHSACG